MELKLESKWYDDGLQLAKWSPSSKKILSKAFFVLREILLHKLGPYCMHLKGRGGIKGSVRLLHRKLAQFPYSARVDVASYYGSVDHNILIKQLLDFNLPKPIMDIIKDYISIPDSEQNGKGIVAGGALSTLLGAVYLFPLDSAMNHLYIKGHIFYLRYQDDIVILAKTRWKLRQAMKLLFESLDMLQLKIHKKEKFFLGKASRGFSFLGYFFKPNRKPRPSRESLNRFVRNVKQLLEQIQSVKNGEDVMTPPGPNITAHSFMNRLLDYIRKFHSYLRAGLGSAASNRRLYKLIKFIEFKLRVRMNWIA